MARALMKCVFPLSTLPVRTRLRRAQADSVLVDTSVINHSVTHESRWVSTGKTMWGPHEIDTGYLARVPIHSPANDGDTYFDVRFLPGIADLARRGFLKLVSSAELNAEQTRQPIGRFNGYGYFDLAAFHGLKIESLNGVHLDFNDPGKAQLQRLESCDDSLYRGILAGVGQGNSLDAYHLFTAECFGVPYYLTMDFRFLRKLSSLKSEEPFASLKTRCLRPSELGELLGLLPVHTWLLSFEAASFPVRPDLHSPTQRRTEPKTVERAKAARSESRRA